MSFCSLALFGAGRLLEACLWVEWGYDNCSWVTLCERMTLYLRLAGYVQASCVTNTFCEGRPLSFLLHSPTLISKAHPTRLSLVSLALVSCHRPSSMRSPLFSQPVQQSVSQALDPHL